MVRQADLPPLLVARMSHIHRMRRGDVEVLKKGALQPVKITTEMRSGNKKARSSLTAARP